MTKRVKQRKRTESTDTRYNRLNKRIVRGLPVTSAETMFVWREKQRRIPGLPRDPWGYAAAIRTH